MKYIKSKRIQKAEGRKGGIYHVTLEVSDYDIVMFEDLHHTYAPFENYDKFNSLIPNDTIECDISILDMNKKYRTWLSKCWSCLHKLWRVYDD